MPAKKTTKKKIDLRLIPEINIGTVGHVDHGKSTLVEAITGKWPATHSEELKRGITIKLGYADGTIYECKKCGFCSTNKCPKCFENCEPVRTVSFVDAPGHETLMATVLAGASLMDAVIFIIAANEKCPQPQTNEHLMVLDISGLKNIIIVQTKIDLVSRERAEESYNEIKEFIKGTVVENAPIIPVSAQQKVNIDTLLKVIQEKMETPDRQDKEKAKMYAVRSFDVNKPGSDISKLKGGVLGGALLKGKVKVGDEVEIKPGVKIKEKWKPIKTKITGLQKAGYDIKEAGPGGLLGLQTTLDPSLTRADSLGGNVIGIDLPDVLNSLELEVTLLEKIGDQQINPIKIGEPLMINVGTAKSLGIVKTSKKKKVSMDLKIPICADSNERVVLSRLISDRWRLIGYGLIK